MGQDSQWRSSMELEILTEILLKPEERAWNGLRNKDLRKTWGDNQAAGIRVRQRVASGVPGDHKVAVLPFKTVFPRSGAVAGSKFN